MENIPALVRGIRNRNSLSIKELAEGCGVSPRTVENWEQNRTDISCPALLILKTQKEEQK